MKQKLANITALGLILQLLCPQAVSADDAGDLLRLHWLCSDFQLPVRAYVVEAWFVLSAYPGLENQLEQQLQIKEGQHQGQLLDGSSLNTSLLRRGAKYYMEVQLITKQFKTAQYYYALWQGFADCYHLERPVGATLIIEMPELLDESAISKLAVELQQSLQADPAELLALEEIRQVAGCSPQMKHYISINGQKINYNLSFTQRQSRTVLYLATPVIYQQY